MSKLVVPRSVEDITADWLTSALATAYPGTVVKALQTGSVLHGTATKVRLMVEYNDTGHAHRLPPTMWYKGGLEAHSDTPDMLIVYAGEAQFFGRIASKLTKSHLPKAFATYLDPESNYSFVILEDLLASNASFGHATKPVDVATTALLLEELAKLHGRFWRSPELEDFTWLKGGGSLLQSVDVLCSPATWDRCIALPRGEFVRGPLRDFKTMRESILHVMQSDVDRANCFVHGDGHLGNTYFTPDGVAGYLDWQSNFIGHWAHDVAYIIITALTVEDRRHHERDLLTHYLAKANEHGVKLDWDEAWLEYRRHPMYACCWSMCLPEWQAEETCCAVVERGIAAANDLDTLGVL